VIRFACPSCKMVLSAPEGCAGRTTKCRGCNTPLIVPQAAPPPPPPPTRQPAPNDKTTLGRLITHTPTGLQADPPARKPAAKPAAKVPAKTAARPQKPVRTEAASPKQPAPPRKRSVLGKLVLLVVILVAVLGAGGLFGFGLLRFMESRNKPADGQDGYAQAADHPDEGSPRPSPSTGGDRPTDAKAPADQPKGRTDEVGSPRQDQPKADDAPPPRADPPRREEPPARRQDPPKTDPMPRQDPTPPRRDEPKAPASDDPKPPPRTEDPKPPPRRDEPKPPPADEPKPPRRDEPKMDQRVMSLLADLKSKKGAERLPVIDDLAKLGAVALPAVGNLCEVLASDSTPATRQAVLNALEKIHPELHKQVVVLLVEADAEKHQLATREIAQLGEQGRGAVPLLLAHIRTAPIRFRNVHNKGESAASKLLKEDLKALVQIAPTDPAVQKVLFDMTRLPPGQTARFVTNDETVPTVAVRGLADIVQNHPDQAKKIGPGLLTATRGMTDVAARGHAIELLGTIADSQPDQQPQIASAFLTIIKAGDLRAVPQLPKCGRSARDAVPVLKKLKLHPTEEVRTAASEALSQIEDILAGKAPPRREEPPARVDSRPEAEDPSLPRELRSLVAKLKSGATEERVKAAAALADMGEKAMPAARALCQAATDPSQKVARAALQALEKVNPDLQQPVFVLVVDEKAANHEQALAKLGSLADQGKPALPVLLHEIKVCTEQLTGPNARWGQSTLIKVITRAMVALVKTAPDDPHAVKALIDLSKLTTQTRFRVRVKDRSIVTEKPFRHSALTLLGEVAENQPEQRKKIIPPLTAALKEAAQQTSSTNANAILDAIAQVEFAGDALIKCGPEAKKTLEKEVLPRLKDLQFNKSDQVRQTAEALRKKIEEAP